MKKKINKAIFFLIAFSMILTSSVQFGMAETATSPKFSFSIDNDGIKENLELRENTEDDGIDYNLYISDLSLFKRKSISMNVEGIDGTDAKVKYYLHGGDELVEKTIDSGNITIEDWCEEGEGEEEPYGTMWFGIYTLDERKGYDETVKKYSKNIELELGNEKKVIKIIPFCTLRKIIISSNKGRDASGNPGITTHRPVEKVDKDTFRSNALEGYETNITADPVISSANSEISTSHFDMDKETKHIEIRLSCDGFESRTYKLDVEPIETEEVPLIKYSLVKPENLKKIQEEFWQCDVGDEVILKANLLYPKGELAYQWFINDSPIPGQNEDKIKIDTTEPFYSNCSLWCQISKKFEGFTYMNSCYDTGEGDYATCFIVAPKEVNPPSIIEEPKDLSGKVGYPFSSQLSVSAMPEDEDRETLCFQWFINDKNEYDGAKRIDGANSYMYQPSAPVSTEPVYYFCEIKSGFGGSEVDGAKVSKPVRTKIATVTAEPLETNFSGKGTKQEPYIINELRDIKELKTLVKNGVSFEGSTFKMDQDITLDKFSSIGEKIDKQKDEMKGANVHPFSGIFDGNGHTITVPEGGKPLFSYVRNAKIMNLNIYGTKINGFGLVDNYFVDEGPTGEGNHNVPIPDSVEIKNVTIKSGTNIKKSGFIGGYAKAANDINIYNCTVEKGVVIGYDKDQINIGSIAGDFNGSIYNCKSSATVYGLSYVGGIVGSKGNSMGEYTIANSEFDGIVEGDKYVGGIAGGAYGGTGWGIHTAPNTKAAIIKNCFSKGSIRGKDFVGGILGAEPGIIQCWENGIGYIESNLFTGKVEATSGSNVGGIVGYFHGINKYTNINDNYFIEGCGSDKGIGGGKYVDTSAVVSGLYNGFTYVNTSKETPVIKDTDFPWKMKSDHNRTDEPYGKDKERLAKMVHIADIKSGKVTDDLNKSKGSFGTWTQENNEPKLSMQPVVVGFEVAGNYKDTYYIGDKLDTTGMRFTAIWSDGKKENIDVKDVEITGFNSSNRALLVLKAKYKNIEKDIVVKVIFKEIETPGNNNISVNFTLLGTKKTNFSEVPEGEKAHTLKNGNLDAWIEKNTYLLPVNSTAGDLFRKVLSEKNLKWLGNDQNQYHSLYISGIQIPGTEDYLSEFDNGKNSGWMYTVNGHHPEVGVDAYFLSNGDDMIFHYTEDYTKEEGSEKWAAAVTAVSAEVSTSKDGKNEITTVKTDVTKGTETGAGGASISTAAVTVKEANAAEMVKQAKGNKSSEIVLDAKSAEADADKVKLELPKKVAENILSDTSSDLTLKLPETEVKINQSALKEIASQAKGDKLLIEVLKVKNPTEEQKKSAGESAEVFALTVKSGDTVIHNFGAGNVTVRKLIPERLIQKKVAAIYIPEKSEIEVMSGKKVAIDKKNYYEFTTTHFSDFALVDAEEIGIETTEAMTMEEIKSIVKDLKIRATTKALKKSIRVTVKTDKETLTNLKDSGYTFKYKYYRAAKKSGKYKLISTKKSSKFTDSKITNGKTYYYKARLAVYDDEGRLVATTSLKNCKASKRQLKKAA